MLSGIIIAAIGSRDVREMKGIGRRSPLIGIFLTIALLSLGGIPITGGFYSKLLVIISAFNGYHSAAMNIFIVIMAIINSVLALGGYLYILKYMLFDEPDAKAADKIKIPIVQTIVMIIIVVLIIFIGIWPDSILQFIGLAV